MFPQLLLAHTPPIPFHTLKQSKGEYVITFPSAFHFVSNSGFNAAEAINFPYNINSSRYALEVHAKKSVNLNCDWISVPSSTHCHSGMCQDETIGRNKWKGPIRLPKKFPLGQQNGLRLILWFL